MVILRQAADVKESWSKPRQALAFHSIPVGNLTEQVFLLRYGIGFCHYGGLTNVSVAINGAESEVLFDGAQGDFVGLDQCNVRLPNSLAGRGEISLALTVDGRTSNTVTARIK